jgi:hypothetical protein
MAIVRCFWKRFSCGILRECYYGTVLAMSKSGYTRVASRRHLVERFKVDTHVEHVELNNREKVGGSSLQTKAEATRTVPSHLQSNMKLRDKENTSILLGGRQHDRDRTRRAWGRDVLAGYMTTWSREDETERNYSCWGTV